MKTADVPQFSLENRIEFLESEVGGLKKSREITLGVLESMTETLKNITETLDLVTQKQF